MYVCSACGNFFGFRAAAHPQCCNARGSSRPSLDSSAGRLRVLRCRSGPDVVVQHDPHTRTSSQRRSADRNPETRSARNGTKASSMLISSSHCRHLTEVHTQAVYRIGRQRPADHSQHVHCFEWLCACFFASHLLPKGRAGRDSTRRIVTSGTTRG